MFNFIRDYFDPFVTVGFCRFQTTFTDTENEKALHIAFLSISKKGRRRVELRKHEDSIYQRSMKKHQYLLVLKIWEKGGKFPDNFEALPKKRATFAEMLARLVQEDLTGED